METILVSKCLNRVRLVSQMEEGLEVRASICSEEGEYYLRAYKKNYLTQSLMSEPRRIFYRGYKTLEQARKSLSKLTDSWAKGFLEKDPVLS